MAEKQSRREDVDEKAVAYLQDSFRRVGLSARVAGHLIGDSLIKSRVSRLSNQESQNNAT